LHHCNPEAAHVLGYFVELGQERAALTSAALLILIELLNINDGKMLAVPFGMSRIGCSAMLIYLP